MRLFQAQVMDEHLEDVALAVSSDGYAFLLARAETLKFICVVDQVSGGAPTLTLSLWGGTEDVGETTKTLLNGVALVSGTNAFSAYYSTQDATYPPPRELWVLATTGGTTPKAHVQVWVCGRGPQLLEATTGTATFAAQVAASKQLADENLIPFKKRAPRLGASVFHPPELLYPSLKWER